MTITISTFAWVPPFAQGYVRDIRARWALAEAGLEYDLHLVEGDERDSADYRAWQPFGQVPAYRDESIELFESGAIVMHIASLSEALAPRSSKEAAQIQAWVLAALNSIEPKIDNLILPGIFHAGESWVDGWRPHAERLVAMRLKSLAGWMKGRDWLVGRFTVADIIMATVLRPVMDERIFKSHSDLVAYLDRCLSRPAFNQALQAQLDTFSAHAPAG